MRGFGGVVGHPQFDAIKQPQGSFKQQSIDLIVFDVEPAARLRALLCIARGLRPVVLEQVAYEIDQPLFVQPSNCCIQLLLRLSLAAAKSVTAFDVGERDVCALQSLGQAG